MIVAASLTRADLIAELAEVVGARHEARFIVDEVREVVSLTSGEGSLGGELDPEAVSAARSMAARRAAGEPLQYIFGHWPFRTLDLVVDPRVLIPRPETEQVVEVALAEARRLLAGSTERLVVVDAGTGSGAIALSLASELGASSLREVWATDISEGALAVATRNLEALRRQHTGLLPAIELVRGSWFEPLPPDRVGAVHLVVSNPPYVSALEWVGLDAQVRAEPRRALVAAASSDGTPGLGDVEAVLVGVRDVLSAPGVAVVELGPHQATSAQLVAKRLGFTDVSVRPDLSSRPRALVVRTES